MGNRFEQIRRLINPEKRNELVAAGMGLPMALHGAAALPEYNKAHIIDSKPAIVRDVKDVLPIQKVNLQLVNTRTGEYISPFWLPTQQVVDKRDPEGETFIKTSGANDVIHQRKQHAVLADEKVAAKISEDLSRLELLQHQFDKALGRTDTEGGIIRSYNPVLARWKYEQCITGEEKEQFYEYETLQLKTMLREMCRVESSTIHYAIDSDGKLRNELKPDEPFENMLVRGVEYRKKHNTPEPERERMEVVGFLKIQEKLADPKTPLGSRMVLISPPGIVEDSAYKDNFIDHFTKEADPTTGEVRVKMERIISPMDYEKTIERVQEIVPDYFENYEGPIDGYFLENPFEYYGEVADMEGMKKEIFERIEERCLPFVEHQLRWITAEIYSPIEIAKAYNTLISICTEEIKRVVNDPKGEKEQVIYRDVRREVEVRGSEKTEKSVAGCGRVESFDLQPETNSNSVAKFGDISKAENDPNLCRCKGEKPHFHCPGEITTPKGETKPCKKAIIVGRGIKQCPDCGAGKVC